MRSLTLSLLLLGGLTASGCQSKATSNQASTTETGTPSLDRPRDDRPAPLPLRPSPAPEPTGASTPESPFSEGPPVEAADLHMVDPAELFTQARKVAASREPRAVLISVHANQGVSAGTVDVTGNDGVTFDFQWSYLDNTKPPGADKVEGGLWISARKGRFHVTTHAHASAFMVPAWHRPDPAPDPRCTGRAAWKAALKSGMPENAVASIRYQAAFPGGPGKPYQWMFRVDGHPDLRREIDGQSCAVAGGAPR